MSTVRSYDDRLQTHPETDSEAQLANLLGPVTMAALRSGEQQLYCNWGITGSGAFAYLGVAVIDVHTKDGLVAALRDSVYEELDADGAEARFTQGGSEFHRQTDDIIIDGDLLVVAAHSITGAFAQDSWAGLRGH